MDSEIRAEERRALIEGRPTSRRLVVLRARAIGRPCASTARVSRLHQCPELASEERDEHALCEWHAAVWDAYGPFEDCDAFFPWHPPMSATRRVR